MKDISHGTWQEIAWNGISFNAPQRWTPGAIGKRYLLFEDESGPVMEIKWSRIKGNFRHKKQFRHIARNHKKSVVKNLNESEIPAGWKKAVDRYKASFFSWIGKNINGKGAIIYCPHCRQASLVQFFTGETFDENSIKEVLSSFRDHDSSGYLNFHIFDIRARVPDHFRLIRYCFEPGLFEIGFRSKESIVTYHSWGPASFLLKGRSLLQFAQTVFQISRKDIACIDQNNDIFECSITPAAFSLKRILGSLKLKYVFQRFRLKYSREKNRIYCIHIKGRKPFDNKYFNMACENYESG